MHSQRAGEKKKSWARKEKQHSTQMKNCMEKKIEGGGGVEG